MTTSKPLAAGILAWLSLTCSAVSLADTTVPRPPRLAGSVEAIVDGQTVVFPSLKTDIEADIQGDLSTVTITQTFANPLQTALHANYLFPLNKDAAVYEMIMEVGDEIVHAQIQRVEEARKTFQTAKQEGKSAALLTQHRPNMFTQDIANLMPGLPIKVTLRYVQTVPKVDGVYELVVPLVVGPRFQPPGAGVAPHIAENPDSLEGIGISDHAADGVERWDLDDPPSVAGGATLADSHTQFGQWELEQLPAYPPVSGMEIPEQIDPDRVALEIRLDGGMPIAKLESATHAIHSEQADPQTRLVTLASGRTIDNRDFVLRYSLAGEDNQAGFLAHRDERGGFFSLLIEPPATPSETDISPREMVFVLDCSGSMSGMPMEASKAFMREALRKLRPSDTFRIIRFSDAATEFSAQPLPATAANVRRGVDYTERLIGSGGTMMTSGIKQALQAPVPEGAIRLVTFLTDGYIGNEFEVLRLIEENIDSARLFAFGVGTGVNRFLLSEMSRVGRGFTRYMDPTEKIEAVAAELADRLQSPVLTDISIDWGELAPTDLTPTRIPDLFAGYSLRVQGRYEVPGDYEVTVQGKVNGRSASLPLKVKLPEQSKHGEAVALVWARSVIKDAMHTMITPRRLRRYSESNETLKERITELGLDFSLLTQWTSFVAVSQKIYNNEAEDTPTKPVPLPQVKGVSEKAYGAASTYTGYSTPEPETVFGLLMVIVLLIGFVRRRPRSLSLQPPHTVYRSAC